MFVMVSGICIADEADFQEIERLPPVEVQSEYNPVYGSAPLMVSEMSLESAEGAEFTREELQGAMQKLAWTKGDFKFTPYGRLWTTMSRDSQKTNNGEYVLWVNSPDTVEGARFQVDAKSTRLGLDMAGPGIRCLDGAKIGGKLEIDFQGTFLQENKGTILFRHGYVEAKNDDYRLLFGQTWDVISPLYTPTFDYTAGSAAGNLAYRRAQFRVERYLPRSETFMLTLQSALAVDVLVPVSSVHTIQGDHAGWPDWQNRVALTFGDRKNKELPPVEVGVSGHVGEQCFNFYPVTGTPQLDVSRPTWSINLDAKFPITKTFGVQGEVFTGSNLSNYFGGIMQGVDSNTLDAIRDTGGWGDIWYDMRPDLHWHFGYSVDDPLDNDMTTGRTYNQYIYANFIYDFTKFLNAGLEISSWRTLYYNQAPGNDIRVEFLARYNF
jgi:hypothetical protein